MWFFELGHAVRKARLSAGLTQAVLASRAGLTRTTVNQIEAAVCPDLGTKKMIKLLEVLGLKLDVRASGRKERDYLHMACVSANVSLRRAITPDELAHAFLTGKVDKELRPHLRVLFEEAPRTVLKGVIHQLESRTSRPERVTHNIASLAKRLGSELEELA